MIGLNEAHAAHIRRQIIHVLDVLHHFEAIIEVPQIDLVKFVTEDTLFEILVPLPIGRDNIVSILLQTLRQMRPDETA